MAQKKGPAGYDTADKVIEKIAAQPAIAIDKTAQLAQAAGKRFTENKPVEQVRGYWRKTLGPGLTTGAADDDPSGIGTYSQAGAQFGLNAVWFALWSLPFLYVIQEMSARIGFATGRGLAGVIRAHYPRSVLYILMFLLLVANTINIGVNIGAMAASLHLVWRFPIAAGAVFFTGLSLILQIFMPYSRYSRYLKLLTLVLLAYVGVSLFIDVNWAQAFKSALLPHFEWSTGYLVIALAVLGTTISPYLMFWEPSQIVEEEKERGNTTLESRRRAVTLARLKRLRLDTFTGMAYSNVIMFFIILSAAGTLYAAGVTDITTAAQAAAALGPLAGDNASLLFAIGIIGTGLLAIPVLAGSASYAFAEGFGWREGLTEKLHRAHGFYGVITIATLFGLVINFLGINPIKALIFAALFNGMIAPPMILMMLLIANNKKIMRGFTNGLAANFFGWTIFTLNALGVIVTIWWLVTGKL